MIGGEELRFSDVYEKHIYYVIFDPVEDCEFNGRHLALVIKKNKDGKTAIVVPLTSKENGVGSNKVNIGKIPNLPSNIRNNDSYVVYNQVRTVNCSRFIALKEGQARTRVSVPVDPELFNSILSICSDELFSAVSNGEKLNHHYMKYVELSVQELINDAYAIIKLLKQDLVKEIRDEINQISSRIKALSNNINFSEHIGDIDRKNGVVEIINKSIAGTILSEINSKEIDTAS